MFELGRELKRFFATERTKTPADGLTAGDSSLLELLDSNLLAQEAKASDIAAGRMGAKDKPRRRLEAAIVWREVARRTGDAVAYRIMITAHQKGSCVVAVYARDIAETKVKEAMDYAKEAGFPLMFTAEPEE